MMQAVDYDQELIKDIAKFYDDPLGFVRYAFSWGEGSLQGAKIQGWQEDELRSIGEKLQNKSKTIQEAISSGHGIGKSAMTSWLILWTMSTRPHLNGVVTANTKNQLDTKTWRELALWNNRLINKHWFEWTATKFYAKGHESTWYVSSIPNTEHNSESFAGLHAEHVLVIYDEASAIPDKIWEVTEGAMTTDGAMWFVFGNPTQNTGRFSQCWGSQKHRWETRQVDSRTVDITNKDKIKQWIDDYGEDSDFVRVRVRGLFPRQASGQFISSSIVNAAQKRELDLDKDQPVIIGVDVARYGDDQSVIAIRQGRKLKPLIKFRSLSNVDLSREIVKIYKAENPDAIFIDGGGVGGGVIDILRSWGYNPFEVLNNHRPINYKKFRMKVDENWGIMSDWLNNADIPVQDNELADELQARMYSYDDKMRIVLEKKDAMKKRGLSSPDCADAVALTFSQNILKYKKTVVKKDTFNKSTNIPNHLLWR